MRGTAIGGLWVLALAMQPVVYSATAADAPAGGIDPALALLGQKSVELAVRVVNKDGKPVANAKVTPWALRSSQGHGWWRKEMKEVGMSPEAVVSDDEGKATVRYPLYHDKREQIRTIGVSLQVDHPDYAYQSDLHIDVPLETTGPYQITLENGVPLDIRVVQDGQPVDLNNVFAFWSDGRSHQPGSAPEVSGAGKLRIPALPAGDNSVLLAKFDGDRVTHFSRIHDVKLALGEPNEPTIALEPGVAIKGSLSADVPRPVRNGRISAWSLEPAPSSHRVLWCTWVPIDEEGTFTIESWPSGEAIQIIALCDGFIAANGKAPDGVKNRFEPSKDPFGRPQVFKPGEQEQIELAMTPLVQCMVNVIDEDEKPVAGIKVASWPNVGWWNGGSQLYCHPLVRGERRLRERDYQASIDETFSQPFQATSDATGKAIIELPVGKESLVIESDVYELPVFLGQREIDVELKAGEVTEATLRLQPRGTEKLGEWDKLAGVVFGCSTREGRRICALPEVRAKMDEFTRRFREGKNQRDPQLLSEAYTAVADAFDGVGDKAEAAKWRKKSDEQAAKALDARSSKIEGKD